MIEIPFIYVQIAALCSYAFLLISLMAAKKTKPIRNFIILLLCNACWTGGSLLMRLLVFPGYEFWYDVSILSLFAIPFSLYLFVHDFVGAKGYFITRLMAAVTVIMLVLTQRQVFLKRPTYSYMYSGDGHIHGYFHYTISWTLVFPTVIFLIMIISIGAMVYRAMKSRESLSAMVPLLVGILLVVAGNLLSVLPGNIFPFDTLAGILNACAIFYALYRKRLLKMTLLVSRGTIMTLSVIVASVLFITPSMWLERMISSYFPYFASYTTVFISVLFAGIALLVYQLAYRIVNNLFIKEELLQAEKLSAFSVSISKSLDLNEIVSLLITLVTEVLGVNKAYFCIYSEETKSYRLKGMLSPLDAKTFAFQKEHPCIQWLIKNKSCLLFKEFQRMAGYKAMWELEKQQMAELGVQCLVPLVYDDGLIGVLVLTQKAKNAAYTYDDITFLESAQSIASIALKNANLYQLAYTEARTDHLTGLLNRKCFFEQIHAQFEKNRNSALALIILNVDNFKLYNQLYGNHEGDLALINIARIIRNMMAGQGFAARYNGKEFAIVLPEWDTLKSLNLAKMILQKVVTMNNSEDGRQLKVLTMSGGVCVYPYAASSVAQLISNADMAVYSAKRSGKNKILSYSIERPEGDFAAGVQIIPKTNYSDYASTIFALTAAIDAKDHYTFNHSQNVAKYATALARAIGLNEDHVQLVNEAALLHDIGKIGIPENILTKPERLSDEEYVVMQKHVENSISIIRHLPSLDYVIPAAISHHERWDGRGYPRGIGREDIPIAGRCLAIADTFDAMTNDRPYRDAMSVSVAIRELEQNAGTQFDPKLVPIFVDLVKSGQLVVERKQFQAAFV